MCQSVEDGGKRCRGKGKSSFYPKSLEKDLSPTDYICPQCGQQGTRGASHSCPLKNVLTDDMMTIKVILDKHGIPGIVDADDVRKIIEARAKGEHEPTIAIKVDSKYSQQLSNAGIENMELVSEKTTFSLDTLHYDVNSGNIVDNNGGLADIRDGVIRSVSPLKDDPASVLRGAVLRAETGYSVAPETIAEARASVDLYESIPKEQRWEQWEAITLSKTPSKALQAIHEMGWESNFPEIAALRGVPQSPIWHPEGSVEVHIQQAADVAAKMADRDGLSREDRSLVVMAAMTHDFGKSVSTTIDDDGNVNSYDHETTGVPLARSFLANIGANETIKTQVPSLIRCHMHHASDPTEKSVRSLKKKLDSYGTGTTLETWARLAESDQAGRGSAGVFGVRERWLEMNARVVKKDSAKPIKKLVDGKFLTSNGYKPGESFRDILKGASDAVNNGDIKNEEDAKKWLRTNFPQP